jgi:hypothetical protein
VVVAAANERAKEEAEAKAKDSVAVGASPAQEVVVESKPDNGIVNYAVVGGLLEQGRRVISASGSNHAWRVGERGKIEFTSNGGKQWKEQASGVTASLTSGSAPSKKICWIAGKGGVLLLTTDAGKHWKQVATPTAADLGGVTAVDGLRARIRDEADTTAYETSDGGKTWSAIPIE